jgi:4-pyridoxate dehydrogenase
LEAGGWDRDLLIHMPLAWGKILLDRRHDWGYETEADPSTGNRRIECMRGKVVGGSSSVNAMAYVRGHRADYDRWAAMGASGWSYSDVLPYFRRQESWEGGENFYRGGRGPLATRKSKYEDPLVDAYIEATVQAGYPYNDDYNAAEQYGVSRMQMTIRKGRRESAATAYLYPALSRDALTVEVNAQVTRIVMDGCRAVGVDYIRDGEHCTARVGREVIVSAGTINSPQLLMLSGIGPAEELVRHNIPVRVSLAGVGQNLQDHAAALILYGRCSPGPVHRNMRLDRLVRELGRGYLFGTGFTTDLPGGITAFLKTDAREALPDTQLLFIAGPPGRCTLFTVPERLRRHLCLPYCSPTTGKPWRRQLGVVKPIGSPSHSAKAPSDGPGLVDNARCGRALSQYCAPTSGCIIHHGRAGAPGCCAHR